MSARDLGAAWRELAGSGTIALGDLRVWQTDVKVATGPVIAGLDTRGLRHLLIPTEAVVREDRISRGIHIVSRSLIDDGKDRLFIDVACRLSPLNDLFGLVAAEMLEGLGSHPGNPRSECQRVLDRWRQLLERDRGAMLGQEMLAGLFAELWHLLAIATRDPALALKTWRGPMGHQHDFSAGLLALEVKATLAREGRFIEIHGVEQLLPPPGGQLHLAVVRLEVDGPGARSIPDLIRRAEEAGISRLQLATLLERIGYNLADTQAYEEIRFSVRDRWTYLVDDDCPRIVPGSFSIGTVPPGVSRVRYVIDLARQPPVPLAGDQVEHLLDCLATNAS